MRQPTQEELRDRKPGRSFDDPSQPLGQGILERSGPSATPDEDFRARDKQTDVPHNGIAERAKAISVLRKFDELVAEANPPAYNEASLRRVLELAAGRTGLTIEEYDGLVRDDTELIALERKVFDAARAQFPSAPTKPAVPSTGD